MSKFFLIVGCAHSRVPDLEQICLYVKQAYQLKTILLAKKPKDNAYNICDVVFDMNLTDENFLESALSNISEYPIKGGLLFSDESIKNGPSLFKNLGILCDEQELGRNAYSKLSFRKHEEKYLSTYGTDDIFRPCYKEVTSFSDVLNFAKDNPEGFILKPVSEAASRGVLKLNISSDLEKSFKELECYAHGGLICETLIPFNREFSFDGFSTFSFLTEKIVSSGQYPVEIGQVLPADISVEEASRIKSHGIIMNSLTGQKIGAFHNEIGYVDSTHQTASIEANRRPGGMGIWNLAEKVYGHNLYQLLVDAAMGKNLSDILFEPQGKAITCMLGSAEDLIDDLEPHIDLINKEFEINIIDNIEILSFRWINTQPQSVPLIPKSNHDFIAEVYVYSSKSTLPTKLMFSAVQNAWNKSLHIVKKRKLIA
ncbi:hypothetical protein P0Y67_08180 [Photobacterium sp. SP02]|uniref:ATP-grasp domain-containing protein n=1 Tax=Photobacterium sp. SP02 TaxID=3032280 RepID=UPI00314559CB